MRVSIVTLGCKVNQCESASIAAALIKRNIETSEGLKPADVYVLNTCSVTTEADRKSRQYISKMIKQSPECKIIVIGCSSQKNAELFNKANVVAIGGTKNKTSFTIQAIENIQNNINYSILSYRILYQNSTDLTKSGYFGEEYPVYDKTRSFVKIQDGCNRFCTYCIIPYLRGRSVSRSIDDILNECKSVNSGEIVLTGIDVSSYGKDIGKSFAELIKALGQVSARKRLSSLECEAINDEFLQAMSDSGFCPHFHLSLQSGSDGVLRAMNRKYDTEYYYNKVRLIRKYFGLAGITTDVIVGFPTETDNDFTESLEFIKRCEFSDIHVFPYSSREGTLASKKYNPLPKSVISDREAQLLAVKQTARDAFIVKNIGTVADVYAESERDSYSVGYTPNYIKVYSHTPRNSIKKVNLIKPLFDGILGE